MNNFEIMKARSLLFRHNIEQSLIGKRAFFKADPDEIILDENGTLEIIRINVELFRSSVNVLAIDKENNVRYHGDLPYSDIQRLREACEPMRTL